MLIDPKEARDALLELVRAEMPRRQDLIANRSMMGEEAMQAYLARLIP